MEIVRNAVILHPFSGVLSRTLMIASTPRADFSPFFLKQSVPYLLRQISGYGRIERKGSFFLGRRDGAKFALLLAGDVFKKGAHGAGWRFLFYEADKRKAPGQKRGAFCYFVFRMPSRSTAES